MLVDDVLKKRELSSMDPIIVQQYIDSFFKTHHKTKIKYDTVPYHQFKRSAEYEYLLKTVRSKLRLVYGMFQKNKKLREKLLKTLNSPNQIAIHKDILRTHQSTKERLPYYQNLYSRLFDFTGIPNSILDIASGLNPLSIPFMHCTPEYIAIELNSIDCDYLNTFFKKIKYNGSAHPIDVAHHPEKIKKFSADVCFMFKTLDSLEEMQPKIVPILLKNIKSTQCIASFSTKTLSGKPMKIKPKTGR